MKKKIKIKTEEQYYKDKAKESGNPILCPECKVELWLDYAEKITLGNSGLFASLFCSNRVETGNAWFECTTCDERYFVENYKESSKYRETKDKK